MQLQPNKIKLMYKNLKRKINEKSKLATRKKKQRKKKDKEIMT